MPASDVWHQLIGLYSSARTLDQKLEKALDFLSGLIPCECISMFLFDEYEGSLKLKIGTNKKQNITVPNFKADAPLWKMFESGKVSKIGEQQIKGQYPSTDVFFENISIVKSVAFAPIYDEKKNKIGLVRLLNRKEDGSICDFQDAELSDIESISNIVGTIITISTLRSKYEAFLDSVTHELLAPISGSRNAGFFMREVFNRGKDIDEDFDVRETIYAKIDDVIRFSEQAISLIQGLTMYTKSGRMSRSDLHLRISHLFSDVIEKCRGSLTPLLRSRNFEHGAIRCIDRSRWPLMNIDRKIFHQVFNNILSNSIKYAHEDKTAFNVIIELDTVQNGDAVVVIQDYGVGLQKEEAERIFDPTFRGKYAREKIPTGTGIGLTTVRNLLAVHECSINITNLINPTEFTITIPKKYVVGGRKK